ncbi:hypothetical protein RHS02_07855, partial [Rhizoctonia solani]
MSDISTSPYICVREWEAAGTHLEQALIAYHDHCHALSARRFESESDVYDIVSQIDHSLESFYTSLEKQIAQSRRTLALIRNELVGQFYTLPDEILVEIFTLVVYDQSDSHVPFIEDHISRLYCQLNSLLAVCSVWRRVGISHGALWTYIPIISRKSGWPGRSVTERSYDRAGGRELHLIASMEKDVDHDFTETIRNNYSRFRSINIVFENKMPLRRGILPLFKRKPASQVLIELSLYHLLDPSEEVGHDLPEEITSLTSLQPSAPFSSSIDQTVKQLRVLQLKHILIHWKLMSLPNLVELRIESVMLGNKSSLRELLFTFTRTNSGFAPQPTEALPRGSVRRRHPAHTGVNPPSLYQISLFLTHKMITTIGTSAGQEFIHGVEDLLPMIHGMNVDTLLIQGDDIWGTWIQPTLLQSLLCSLPHVPVLKVDACKLDHDNLEALTNRENDMSFPKLCELYFSNVEVDFHTQAQFESWKRCISSHPIRHIMFGSTTVCNPSHLAEQNLTSDFPVVQWLREKVPDFCLLGEKYTPPEFQTHHWQMW